MLSLFRVFIELTYGKGHVFMEVPVSWVKTLMNKVEIYRGQQLQSTEVEKKMSLYLREGNNEGED